MLKPKKYDWKDSNLAQIGSDLDKDARLDSAENERAWDGCGEKEDLKIWRIEKFKVKDWPKGKYGEFHEGDSYIIYHAYKNGDDSEKLLYDIYFWIGGNSTQDEYGVAAYKTVELDAKLRDAAVQHREVMNHESEQFKNLFDGEIHYLEGGIESGFNHYEPETPDPELFRVKGEKDRIQYKKVKLRKDSLNSDDVFILDLWTTLYQWNGKKANAHEKLKATQYLDSVVLARGKDTKKEVFEEGQENEEFWSYLPDKYSVGCITLKTYEVQPDAKELDSEVKIFKKRLYRLRDSGNDLGFKKITEADAKRANQFSKAYLDGDDVYIMDDGFVCWVWVGKGASAREKGGGMGYAMKYIKKYKRPAYMPIRQVREGAEPLVFLENFHSGPKPSSCSIS